jgi:hypothetical protein
LKIFNLKFALALKLIQPQADDQADRDPDADKHALHHRANGLIALRQFRGGIEFGKAIDDLETHEHKKNGCHAAENGVGKIQQNDVWFHAPSLSVAQAVAVAA